MFLQFRGAMSELGLQRTTYFRLHQAWNHTKGYIIDGAKLSAREKKSMPTNQMRENVQRKVKSRPPGDVHLHVYRSIAGILIQQYFREHVRT